MKMKKAFACLLAVLLICGIMPTGVFADETSDGETTDEPRYKVAIQLTDSETDFTDSNPYYSLEGSVYDIYKDVADPDNYSYWEQEPYATTQATDANGYCEVPGGLPGGNYVAIMRTRATGYRYDRNHYVFGITDKDVLLTATVKPSSITMNIYKNDRDYGTAAGDATLGGAVYRVYYPQGTGETYSDITTDETGLLWWKICLSDKSVCRKSQRRPATSWTRLYTRIISHPAVMKNLLFLTISVSEMKLLKVRLL